MRGQVLGVWFGPRSTRAEVRSADTGALVAAAVVEHRELSPHPLDATAWWRSLALAIARTGERTFDALSVVGAHPGLVLVDGAGVVLRPMQPWSAAGREVDRLHQALGAERWARRAGMVPDAGSAVTRLAWLRRADPATFARIGLALAPHEWLTYRLCGHAVTDPSSASESGLWSPHTGQWIPDVLDQLAPGGGGGQWQRHLPTVAGPPDRADWLTAPVYELLALQGRPVVGPGASEAGAIALALGLRPGQAAVALTERTAALVPVDGPITDASGVVRSRAGADDGHLAITWEPGGATLMQSVADLLHLSLDALGELAVATPPSRTGVTLVPPMDDGAGAVLTGLGPDLTRGAVARAAVDGIACAAANALDELVGAGAAWDEDALHLTGPGPALAVHGRVLADVVGRPVVLTPGSMAAAGACVQATSVLHAAAPLEVADAWALGDGSWIEPQDDPTVAERRATYALERSRQERAWLSD